jgi:hypothetical protein
LRQYVKQLIQRIIKRTPLKPFGDWVVKKRGVRALKNRQIIELGEWERNGKPIPPPHLVKQRTLRSYSKTYGVTILVETGTYYGEMVEAMKHTFDRIYSIELSEVLFERAKDRFKRAKNIKLICGDSGIELGSVVNDLDQPALFWLDGHYSGGETARGDTSTPIFQELSHILGSPIRGHVIIIDDARCFGHEADYPSIRELKEYVTSKRPDLDIVVRCDSIRITPRKANE